VAGVVVVVLVEVVVATVVVVVAAGPIGVVVLVVVVGGLTGAGKDSASLTAPRTLSKPAPCSSAGAPMSVAVLQRISLTSAGDGSAPPCVLE
jgi:hypothetical protein